MKFVRVLRQYPANDEQNWWSLKNYFGSSGKLRHLYDPRSLSVHVPLPGPDRQSGCTLVASNLSRVLAMYSSHPTSRPLSYAPTPYSYTPTSSLSAKINLDEEVKLADSAVERDLLDSLAEIYSIIRTLDGLEKAYIKDAVTETEYTEMCAKLLKQYKSILSDETVSNEFVDLETFGRRWEVCSLSDACRDRCTTTLTVSDRMSASHRAHPYRHALDS